MPNSPSETNYTRKVLIATGIAVAAFLLALIVHFSLDILMFLFTGALLAILYRGCSFWLGSKIKIHPNKLVPVIILFHLGFSVLTIYLLSPQISDQIETLSQELPDTIRELADDFLQTRLGGIIERNLPTEGINNTMPLFETAFDIVAVVFEVIVAIVLIYVFALFLSFDPSLYKNGFLVLFPPHKRERINEAWEKVNATLFRWFIGKIVDMTSIFIMTAIALWILDIPLVLTLALIAFLFSFVPNIGPIISAIPAMLIAFNKEPIYAVYVGLIYLGIQMIESYFITPKVQKRAIKMPPVLLLGFQLIMASFAGVLGLFIATPVLAAIIIIVRMLYVEDVLEKRPDKTNS